MHIVVDASLINGCTELFFKSATFVKLKQPKKTKAISNKTAVYEDKKKTLIQRYKSLHLHHPN